ncbi:DUF2064 domain-containing protein [Luteipulveratus sp. YIM 133132]|uniref:TIGR04282 family arsenosugar biosynthesis glycosyltransferase n=1 Tax=Luteipulveratus flavus TaxID=3031728 RepID=UPI0023B0C769|nr:DUF2064 domain-containing protein [Luteipulveratus sp. YIM 133132]MDE9364758.1 DUF2064 domain-containing protein [Luteipulveratus sp. YIM 133132]
MTDLPTLVVIAKTPVPGRVKTRLSSRVSAVDAAAVAQAALLDTLDALTSAPARRRVLLLAGPAGPWVPDGWDLVAQVDGGLDHRIAAGLGKLGDGPALLVGMDTPQVGPALLEVDWGAYDACLGRATDGGYWALGLADPALAPQVVEGVPMSRSLTGQVQRQRLRDAGLRVADLPELRDVDTPADADAVARLAPHTRFARRWREVTAR